MQVERSTVEHYRKQAKVICRYLGSYRLADVTIPVVNGWMMQMVKEGYAPRSVSKPFGLLRQALNYAVVLDLVHKNPCDHCRPPKVKRKKMQVLDREQRTRMLKIAQAAEPSHHSRRLHAKVFLKRTGDELSHGHEHPHEREGRRGSGGIHVEVRHDVGLEDAVQVARADGEAVQRAAYQHDDAESTRLGAALFISSAAHELILPVAPIIGIRLIASL
jgi:hypothetical protein